LAVRNEHLVVIMVEPAPVGEFVVWPPHITIVPWFPVDDPGRLDKVLSRIAARHKIFQVKVGRLADWGKKKPFEVQMIKESGDLHRLHWDVFHALEKSGFPVHQKEHLGAKYRPHFIYKKTNKVKEGDTIAVVSFVLFKQIRLKKTGTMIKRAAKEYFLSA